MKFKTFQALLIGGGIVVAVLVFALVRQAMLDRPPAPAQGMVASTSATPVEAALLAQLGQPSRGETKIKDLLGSGAPKVNLYADAGTWNRAKVDLDRDEKWDEKWRWEAGIVYRATAPGDDEVYGAEQVVGAPPGAAEPAARNEPAAAGELREVDTLLLELLELPVQDKIKDASKGRAFKINLYSDEGQRFNRAKVDLDRDDKWDESWTLEADGRIERKVAPNDDENYTQRFTLEARARWQPLP